MTRPTVRGLLVCGSGLCSAALPAAAVVMAVAVAIFTATASAGGRCRIASGATVVHQSATATVYRQQRAVTTARYVACLHSSGRATDLPGSSSSRSLSSFRSAGRYLAFIEEQAVPHDMTASVAIRVFDLRAGAPRRGIVLAVAPGQSDSLRLRSLILTSNGTAAWRETGRSQQASAPVDRIAARDVSGKRRILETAPYKSISRLKLVSGKIAEWIVGGRTERRRLDTLGR